jgi:hypothetical protein
MGFLRNFAVTFRNSTATTGKALTPNVFNEITASAGSFTSGRLDRAIRFCGAVGNGQ